MNVYEMEGFLRGNGIPGDLKVNESNAQYLVRKFSELQSQNADLAVQLANAESNCMELAAENAATDNRMQQLIQIINNADNDYCMCGDAMSIHTHGGCGHPTGMFDYYYGQWMKSDNKTSSTDAFLAEVRAQGVEMFADHILCPDLDGTIREFAAKLRKGAAL
ncbi:hNH endonuclease [Citrobacter freundii]